MKQERNFLNKKRFFHRGFTLMEVLLAMMIVGLIAIALASLTRAAGRANATGRSKVVMRNNLSSLTRQLRKDFAKASFVQRVKGPISQEDIAGALGNGAPQILLFQLAQNVKLDGITKINGTEEKRYVSYCFEPTGLGSDLFSGSVQPSGSRRYGKIYRYEKDNTFLTVGEDFCPSAASLCGNTLVCKAELVAENVKYIPDTDNYPVPLFEQITPWGGNDSDLNGRAFIQANIILETVSGTIVENELLEETLTGPIIRTVE